MFRKTVAVLSSAATIAWSLHAFALGDVTIYDNAQSVPVGGRAAGMGGAYTALACDEGALHYNPASLSCAAASHLELTANAYVLQGIRATGALGPGQNVSATTFHSIPSIVGAVHILSEGSGRTFFDTYPKRLTFGFTVSVPTTVALKFERPSSPGRNYASSSIREDLTEGYLGLGYQLNKEISIGVALGGAMRTSERHSSFLLVREHGTPCELGVCNDFLADEQDRSSFAIGAHAKVGALIRPYRNLSFGLALTAPSIHLYGHAVDSSTVTRADINGYSAIPTRATGSSEVGLPARIALGFAFVRRRYTFSGDLSVNLPHRVRLAYDMKADPTAGVPTQAVPDRVLSPNAQPNLNLGASVPFGTTKEVNIGFFTDLSSVSQADIDRNGLSRVHMFGSSISLGLLGKQARAWIGASAEIGHTTLRTPGRSFTYERVAPLPAGNLPSDNEATLTRWTVAGILGSNYSFLE
jgi:long-subunit fatty acid transport protein